MWKLIVLFVLGAEITNYDLFPRESNTLTASLGQACVIFMHWRQLWWWTFLLPPCFVSVYTYSTNIL